MAASLLRMTACELRGLPKALRWFVHLEENINDKNVRQKLYVLQTLLYDYPLTSCRATAHNPSLMVEVTTGRQYVLVLDQVHRKFSTNLRMTKIPPPSGPRVFSTGTFTFSNYGRQLFRIVKLNLSTRYSL